MSPWSAVSHASSIGQSLRSPSLHMPMAGLWWELAAGGVDSSIPGNGGEECMTYLPTWQLFLETLIIVPLTLRLIINTLPTLDCSFSTRPKNDSRYGVLTVYSIIFGAELAFKMISRTGIFLLNPCHITTAMQLILLTMDANDRKACFLFRLHMFFMPGAFFALAFPILNTRLLPGEVFIYYAQHIAILLVPIYLMYLKGAFEPEKAYDYTWAAFGLSCFLLYHFAVLQPMAMYSRVNLNNIMCPAISDPFQSRAYRVIACAHQTLLIPIISKTYSAIASCVIDIFNGLFPEKQDGENEWHPLLLMEVTADRYVDQLLENLLMDYNRNVRPVKNASDALQVKFGANLCRLIDVDEVNQVLTTSLWLEMQWTDRKLVWNPAEWGGVERIHIPSDQIWIPDILLYNNADGEPHITIDSLTLVDFRGTVLWQPPSIYKSLCNINIENFPYDSQECTLKFGGWSNDGQTLALEQIPVHIKDKPERRVDESGAEYLYLEQGLGLSFYHESAEWDLLSATSSRYAQIYPGCCGQQFYIDIRYNIVIRRKAIFFTVMLTIPCMLLANSTPFVFVIPPNEHKMTFSISIFVAFTLFYLVLIELIPPTSLVLPLIGKYLLFTLMMITVSILISVVNVNIYRRQAFASEMSPWQQWLFVKTLPRLLKLKPLEEPEQSDANSIATMDSQTEPEPEKLEVKMSKRTFHTPRLRLLSLIEMDQAMKRKNRTANVDLLRKLAGSIKIIAANFHNRKMENKISDEWRLMSLVVDRVCLILYLVMNVIGNVLFIYNSPTLYDDRPSLGKTVPFSPLSGDAVNVFHSKMFDY
ncbi:unnamed protein product [Cylicocyclus nassatus]|uniref:Uncharacterized protein n=1 Tax=Cylicocyclus nassatus TaxID=53992 RepID=A0AA36HE94_CYLNA|nr:unnamed protein product [Cylicocyclus nassatus]